MEVTCKVFEADRPNVNGGVYTLDLLESLLEMDSRFFIDGACFMFRGELEDFGTTYQKALVMANSISVSAKSLIEINTIDHNSFTFYAPISFETFLAKRFSQILMGASEDFPFEKDSGYKWVLDRGNNFWFDKHKRGREVELEYKEDNLIEYIFQYRYGNHKNMKKMFEGAMVFLDLERFQDFARKHFEKNPVTE